MDQVREDIAVLGLFDRWLEGEMNEKEVKFAAGVRKLAPIMEAAHEELHEEECWRDFISMTDADHERVELERLAHQLYPDFLKEEPGYLDAVITKLKYERDKNRHRIGAALVEK